MPNIFVNSGRSMSVAPDGSGRKAIKEGIDMLEARFL
jgi:hypothetical protein